MRSVLCIYQIPILPESLKVAIKVVPSHYGEHLGSQEGPRTRDGSSRTTPDKV